MKIIKNEFIQILSRFFYIVYHRFVDDGCAYRAAALTYTTLLSLVPLMTVSFAIFSAFPVFSQISSQIQDFIFSHFVAASGQVVQEYLTRFVSQTKNLSALGSAFLVITAILMMFNMEQAFNAIWKVSSRRKGIATFLLYWAILTLSPILIGLSIIVSSYLTQVSIISSTAHHIGLIAALPFLLNLVFFTLIYWVVPNCYVPIKNAFIGALAATILFTVAKLGFAYYVTHFPTYILLYGALATIPLFLIWVYLLWMIILFGVIISHILTSGYHFRSVKKMDGFTHVFLWTGYFWEALLAGEDLSLQQLIDKDSCNYAVDPVQQIQIMQQSKLISETKPGRFILSKELSALTLEEFASFLPWRFPSQEEISKWQGKWIDALKTLLVERDKSLTDFKHIKMTELFS